MPKLCGEMGHKTKTGQPCGYRIAENAEACPHHSPNPWAREFQKKGLLLARTKKLPKGIEVSRLETIDDLFDLCLKVTRSAANDEDADLARHKVILSAGNLAATVLDVKEKARTNDLLARIEHGGAALTMLQRMQESTVQRRPLPGRVRVVNVPTESEEAVAS